jgi:LmbE family N-acetylglucosaminyl deacetylase
MSVSYPPRRCRYRPPVRGNVVVIAPHPDDDAIGCGGTLARLAARGSRIGVVYVTDGGASHPNSKRFPPSVLRDVREHEACAALHQLGVRTAPRFLRAPDGGLARVSAAERQALVRAVALRIDELRAHIVFAPWSRDPHPDHVATAAIVRDALAVCGRWPDLYWYGVWLAVRGEAAEHPRSDEAQSRDVALSTSELERKRSAVMEHRSQTGALIDDDPDGFRIDADMLDAWLTPVERFYVPLGAKRVEAGNDSRA